MKSVVSIAASDSGGGAGLQADLKAIGANGAYGLSVVTAVTAQNTVEVRRSLAMPPALIAAQFDALYADFEPAAIKSGMLVDSDCVEAVRAALSRHPVANYVLDPVMVSTSGHVLLDTAGVTALARDLIPLARLVTPNVHEAELLAKVRIRSLEDARRAAVAILQLGCDAVLVKGGHLASAPATDLLVCADGEQCFEGEYIEAGDTHGTGCTYSAAIAAHLARGAGLGDAIEAAKSYVTQAIRHRLDLGEGASPTDHFYSLRERGDKDS